MGIYDAMKLCRADVSTVCFGLAASMGAFLLCSGSKGKRFCMPNARVMIHQPLGARRARYATGQLLLLACGAYWPMLGPLALAKEEATCLLFALFPPPLSSTDPSSALHPPVAFYS